MLPVLGLGMASSMPRLRSTPRCRRVVSTAWEDRSRWAMTWVKPAAWEDRSRPPKPPAWEERSHWAMPTDWVKPPAWEDRSRWVTDAYHLG